MVEQGTHKPLVSGPNPLVASFFSPPLISHLLDVLLDLIHYYALLLAFFSSYISNSLLPSHDLI